MCIHEGCKIRPIFNVEGETKALYCSEHKKDGMVNVISKTCIHEGCKTRPTYNNEGETKGLYCSEHKKDGMVDVKHKTCIHKGCKTRPNYNKEGEIKALYCLEHKKDGMVNVISKTCIHEGCKKQPTYNKEGETNALYCLEHKKDGMVNVIHKTCSHEGCKTRPNYNNEGETKGLYCSEHKKDGMVDVKHKTCIHEWCLTQVQEKYDGYCLFCYMNLFPYKPVSRNYKTKEYAVVEFVKTTFPDLSWIADKKVHGGCSRRRPDLFLDLGSQIIIVEIDENQHIDYDCSCENKRIMELSQDVGHRPIVFIRFNPDEYEKDGTNITSCWSQNKKGLCVVKKTKKTEWEERLNSLKEQIIYWIHPENTTSKTIEIIQLFYDL
jgi:EsV-1-7 cysteine-rich motif